MRDNSELVLVGTLCGSGYAGAILVMQFFMTIAVVGLESLDVANMIAALSGVLLLGLAFVAGRHAKARRPREERV